MPVYEGVTHPIARDDFPIARPDIKSTGAVHGGYLDIPPSRSTKQATGAVEFLIETYRAATEPIILVPVGPMSNIATALTAEPRLRDLIPELVIMGGANRYGNVTPRAEFNVWADPEAARIVLRSGVRKITLVPLDATHQALVSLDDCAALRALGTPAGEAAALFTERRIEGYDRTQPMKRPNAAPGPRRARGRLDRRSGRHRDDVPARRRRDDRRADGRRDRRRHEPPRRRRAERPRRARGRRAPVRRPPAARDFALTTRPPGLTAAAALPGRAARDATLTPSFHGRSCEAGVPVP